MIHEVDESLRALIQREALNGSDVDVNFETPTRDWASRRNSPTVNVYLYDLREHLDRRHTGMEAVTSDEGRIGAWRSPPRFFLLSYLITAWTQRPEDEHRLLSALLRCFIRKDVIPRDVLVGGLADQTADVIVRAAQPTKDRNLSDVWSALGGELKPSIDIVVDTPFDPAQEISAAPPVIETPRFNFVDQEGAVETRRGRPTAVGHADTSETLPTETVEAGTPEQAGRIFRVRPLR